MDGVSADLTAEWVLKALGETFGTGDAKKSWDISLLPFTPA
jgi:hypothetical protein